jgi:outer membrane protein assembly factor BamB
VAEGDAPPPVKFGPEENVAWSTPLPPGLSSPAVAGGRIYLTGLREKDLLTLALDRGTGKVLWERKAPAERLEETHSSSSPAAASPAADGERVVVFFGSFGLLAYDAEGKELWRKALGPFKNPFGAASSPILLGGLVVQNLDQDQGSYLLALDRATGEARFRIERPEFPRGFSTPIVWESGGRKAIVVAGTLRLKAYAPDDGHELWSVDGLARIVNPTPVAGPELLYVASFSPGGDTGERISMPPFEEYAAANDKDKNGRFTEDEVPKGAMKDRFHQLDADKDGRITREEWDNMARIFDAAKNGILALRPAPAAAAGAEPAPAPQPAWRYERGIPYVPSPVYYRGHLYMVKEGGIFTALDGATGAVTKQGRLPAGGGYYASLVAGGGNVYAASLGGEVVAVAAGASWEVRSTNALGEAIAASPAIADGRLYVRTEKRLFCFAERPRAGASPGGGAR